MGFLKTVGKIGSGIIKGLGAATGLIGPAVQHAYDKKRDERQFEHSREMSEYAYEKDMEMWKMANEYNAPTQQMARLKEAGLNPAMIYGSGGAKTVAATTPKYQAPRPDYRYSAPINPLAILGAFQNTERHNAEMDIIRSTAQIKKNEATSSGIYHYNRAMKMSGQANQEFMRSVFMTADDDLATRIAEGKASTWEREQFRRIQQTEKRNTLLDKQIQWYLLNNLGGTAVSAARLLTGGFSRMLKVAKGARGIPKLRQFKPKGYSDRDWSQFKRLDTSTGEIF